MNHMSMVAIAYDANQNLSQSEIIDLLATGFFWNPSLLVG
jgi:hypothetical protein